MYGRPRVRIEALNYHHHQIVDPRCFLFNLREITYLKIKLTPFQTIRLQYLNR